MRGLRRRAVARLRKETAFGERALRHFAFLIEEHGYKVFEVSDYSLSLVSDVARLVVGYDDRDPSVDLDVSPHFPDPALVDAWGPPRFDVETMGVVLTGTSTWIPFVHGSDPETALVRLAQEVRDRCMPVVLGDFSRGAEMVAHQERRMRRPR